jgi:hypothetical protein
MHERTYSDIYNCSLVLVLILYDHISEHCTLYFMYIQNEKMRCYYCSSVLTYKSSLHQNA